MKNAKDKSITVWVFALSLFVSCLVLYVFSHLHITDYTGDYIGREESDGLAVADFIFYQSSFHKYISFVSLLDTSIFKGEVSGPIMAFILGSRAVSLQATSFIYSLLFASSNAAFNLIASHIIGQKRSAILSLVLIFNPFAYYFIVRPGPEIPFYFTYSLFGLTLYWLYLPRRRIASLVLPFIAVSSFAVALRPTGIPLNFLVLGVFLYFFFKLKHEPFRERLRFFLAILLQIGILVFFIFLYTGYFSRAQGYDSGIYFGFDANQIREHFASMGPIQSKLVFLLWKITYWILGSCGIRDSLGGQINNSPFWQVVLRISIGILIYLPIFIISLIGILAYFANSLTHFLSSKEMRLPGLSTSLAMTGFMCIAPNLAFFPNERYLFMVYPGMLIYSMNICGSHFLEMLKSSRNH